MAKGDTRCIDGDTYRHDPQFDDPDLETNIGRCPYCGGKSCVFPDGGTDDEDDSP
jgi:hypothetical protein